MDRSVELLLRGTQYKRVMEDRIQVLRKRYGLSRMEIEVLFFLERSGNRNTSKEILKVIQVNKGYISQTLDSLTRNGYLTPSQDQHDRRFVHYHLTDKAGDVCRDMAVLWNKLDEEIFAGFTEEDMEALGRIAAKIGVNMERIESM